MSTDKQQRDAHVRGIIYELDDIGMSQVEIQELLLEWATSTDKINKLLREYHGDINVNTDDC